MRKAQAALEYLMIYVIVLIIILIVTMILYSLGILNPNAWIKSACYGFTYFNYEDHRLTANGSLDIVLLNSNKRVQIDGVQVRRKGDDWGGNMDQESFQLSPGEKATINASSNVTGNEYMPYMIEVKIIYHSVVTNLKRSDVATCTGNFASVSEAYTTTTTTNGGGSTPTTLPPSPKDFAIITNPQDRDDHLSACQSLASSYGVNCDEYVFTVEGLDLDNYDVVIFSHDVLDGGEGKILGLDDTFRTNLENYVSNGGLVIITYYTTTPNYLQNPLPPTSLSLKVAQSLGETTAPLETHEITTNPNDVRLLTHDMYDIFQSTSYTVVDTIEDSNGKTIIRILRHGSGHVIIEGWGYSPGASFAESFFENYLQYNANH